MRAVVALLALMLVGCTSTAGNPSSTAPANTIRVLAGSELKDLAPLFPDIEKATGVHLAMTYTGTLDGAESIVNGNTADLAWYAQSKYVTLLQGANRKILAQQPIMLSPVVLGVKASTAQRLGWADNPNVTWRDIATAAKNGQFHFAMTDPSASNSGFSALLGVASAFASSGSALTVADINAPELTDFFSGQALTAGSSGFLADSYVRSQDSLDGIINYESVLLSLNAGAKLHQKLDLVYPKEGIITADYPLMLLNSAKRDVYDKLVRYLRSADVQRRIMQTTNRRPTVPEVQPDSRFPAQVLVELPFPSSLDVINTLLLSYQNQIRLPSHPVFVLDLSGSMQGQRLDGLKRALTNLTGLDTSLTGQFARFRAREQITLITFSSQVLDKRTFTINDPDPRGPDMTALRNYVNGFQAGGGTAIYDALEEAYRTAGAARAQDPSGFYSIVLMTDGENNTGRDGNAFLRDYQHLSPDVRAIKTFTVLFGEASPTELQRIASASGGTVFDSRTAPLSQVFKEIRGYQ
ncbi:MAG TPA: substrate-binding and VWA domain-containing protein [Candidatus Dormibacteraeota bacterium]|nr:substrate-binding and VWA domain-containing protein [Candidatus Dormibacteraeota bacterium]